MALLCWPVCFDPSGPALDRQPEAEGLGWCAANKKRFTVDQITSVLQPVAAAVSAGKSAGRLASLSKRSTSGSKEYGGRLPSEARELKQLREEYPNLKRIDADLLLPDEVFISSYLFHLPRPYVPVQGPHAPNRAAVLIMLM